MSKVADEADPTAVDADDSTALDDITEEEEAPMDDDTADDLLSGEDDLNFEAGLHQILRYLGLLYNLLFDNKGQ